MDAAPVLDAIGDPSTSLSRAASVVFDVTALVDGETLDSFDAPVTITYHYTDADITGLNESTLTMYHYHAGVWLPLSDCSIDTAANTITCDAPSFSTFAIFGSPIAGSSGSSHRSPGTSVTAQVQNLIALGKTDEANALKSDWPNLFPANSSTTTVSITVRDLELGMTGEDVRALQKLLNTHGFVLAASGAGAPGSETDYFGTLTRSAVAAFQQANSVAPAAGYFGPLTRAMMRGKGIAGVWW
jgi:hypothetical protein